MKILDEAIAQAGGMMAFAKAIGINRTAIYRWKDRIPAERVIDVERASGIPRERLRPDIFLAPRPKSLRKAGSAG